MGWGLFGQLGGGTASAPSEDYSDIVFWLNFEENDTTGTYDMSSTNEHSEGDSSGTYGSAATIVAGSVVANSGTYSLFTTSIGHYLSFAVSSNDILPTSHKIAIWFETGATYPTGGELFHADNGAGETYRIEPYGVDELRLQFEWADFQMVTVTTTDADLAASTTYCIEVELDITGNDVTIWRDGTELSDGFVWDDQTTMAEMTGWTVLYIPFSGTSEDLWIGKVIISDDLDRSLYTDFNETVNYPGP